MNWNAFQIKWTNNSCLKTMYDMRDKRMASRHVKKWFSVMTNAAQFVHFISVCLILHILYYTWHFIFCALYNWYKISVSWCSRLFIRVEWITREMPRENLQSLPFLYVDFVSAAFIMNVSFSKYSTYSICIVIAGVLFILFIIDIARVSSEVI